MPGRPLSVRLQSAACARSRGSAYCRAVAHRASAAAHPGTRHRHAARQHGPPSGQPARLRAARGVDREPLGAEPGPSQVSASDRNVLRQGRYAVNGQLAGGVDGPARSPGHALAGRARHDQHRLELGLRPVDLRSADGAAAQRGARAHHRPAGRPARGADGEYVHVRREADTDGDRVVQEIKMRGLLKRYGERAVVNGVSAEVRTGEIVGLLGPNGAGKTTTFYMVVGLVKPDGGTVLLDNDAAEIDLTGAPMYMRSRRGIGYLAQENSIFRKLSVGDNIRLIWEMHGIPREQQEERLGPLLEEFGLLKFINARGDSLSGGERRRVEIARAIATEPAFLLLDEPFTGIDPIAVADIQAMIRQLRDRGLGILITDHQVRETLAIVDRAYILNNGRIEVSGTAHDVLESPIARQFYLGEGFRL